MADQHNFAHRLARIALIAAVRGTATGLGTGAVTLLVWWITTR
jgi:hypothetical protein